MRNATILTVGIVLVAAGSARAEGPQTGTWEIKDGLATNAIKWTGTLVLQKKGDLTYEGHFAWSSSSGDVGKEFFEAIYDPRAKTLTLVDKSVETKKGTLTATTYLAHVSKDGKKLNDGKWQPVSDAAGGKWTATWKKD